jgi:predicted nucleic acid-binding protein
MRVVVDVPSETITAISVDPTDNMFLECAVAGQVDLIVSGDPHLNALEKFRGIPIITPRDLLNRLG